MILAPTQVTIQGKRVWLEFDGPDTVDTVVKAITEYVDYHAANGLGLHIQHNPQLASRERIVTDEPTGRK